jgi:hypothetical protein
LFSQDTNTPILLPALSVKSEIKVGDTAGPAVGSWNLPFDEPAGYDWVHMLKNAETPKQLLNKEERLLNSHPVVGETNHNWEALR